MTEGRLRCEFFLIRYVPDVARGEFANIGVLLREAGRQESGVVRFTRDWNRLRCLASDIDTEMLEALELEIGVHVRETRTAQPPNADSARRARRHACRTRSRSRPRSLVWPRACRLRWTS